MCVCVCVCKCVRVQRHIPAYDSPDTKKSLDLYSGYLPRKSTTAAYASSAVEVSLCIRPEGESA